MQTAILIHGPTASGKTKLSVSLAQKFDGEVVNADSMQVYTDLKVISARPSEAEMQDVPHHLFGHIAASERYSTGRWLDEATATIGDIWRRGKLPIIVGGTGLYHLALCDGLSDIPPVPENIRDEVRAISKTGGAAALRARLMADDAETAARLQPNDRQRHARALEVWMATGKSIGSFQGNKTGAVLSPGKWLGIALTPPRAKLYARIDKRFEGMLMDGATAEARRLLQQGLSPDLPIMKAAGVPWLMSYLREETSPLVAAENAKRDTRRYAKRQFTWINRQFPFWARIPAIELEQRKRVISALFAELDD